MCPGIGASIKNSLLRYKNRPCRERKHRSGGEKQKGSRGIRRGQGYRLVFQFPIRELEKISLEYITGKVNAIVSKLIQENQLKAYDDDVLKNLLNGWFMHIAIHAKNLKELADKKGQFIAIYRGFLLSLKDK